MEGEERGSEEEGVRNGEIACVGTYPVCFQALAYRAVRVVHDAVFLLRYRCHVPWLLAQEPTDPRDVDLHGRSTVCERLAAAHVSPYDLSTRLFASRRSELTPFTHFY